MKRICATQSYKAFQRNILIILTVDYHKSDATFGCEIPQIEDCCFPHRYDISP